MVTVEIHGLGMEEAIGVRSKILKTIFDVPCADKDLDSVKVCYDGAVIGHNGEKRPQLRVLTNLSSMENNLIVVELSYLKLPIHIICTQVYEG